MPFVDVAFIQLKLGTKLPLNSTAYTMWDGCEQLGIETRFFEFIKDIEKDLTRKTLVHGGVTTVRRAWTLMGVPLPEVMDAPDELRPYFGREMWTTTMAEVRRWWPIGKKAFIKPLRVQKAFTGYVVGCFRDLIQTASIEDDFEILASEPVNFVSEYRIFVNRGVMVDCRPYRGDFTVSPDFKIAQAAILDFKSAPISYSLDLGITDEGRTLVVEVNDAWSLGCYGMASIPYASFVLDRWTEVVGGS